MNKAETHSSSFRAPSPTPDVPPTLVFRRLSDMQSLAMVEQSWLWHGYLRPGSVTLLTSQWKAGKTTLVSVLLSKLKDGGTFLGLPLRAGNAVVISEESNSHWLDRAQRLSFPPGTRWLCRPFRGRPRPEEWIALIDQIVREHEKEKIDLVVIDPLASFLPGRSENDAGSMLDVLLPLQRLTALGICVLVLHHPKKGETSPGQAARGSGALTGYVDIIIEMNWFARPDEDDRRRRLLAFSRHDQTPRRLLIELNAAGTDYVTHGDFIIDDFEESWQVVLGVLEEAHNKLTRQAILEAWPADFAKPNEATLWRWLDRAVADGRVLKDGSGRRHKPFRYWLVAQEEKWQLDPFHLPEMPALEDLVMAQAARGMMEGCPKPKKKR